MGLTKVWNTDKIVIMHDHLMPACLEGDPRSLEAGYELVKEYGIRHFHAAGGIVHQLVPELGYSKPGDIVFVTDSHTPTYGAVGCFSTGVGYTEMAAVWALARCGCVCQAALRSRSTVCFRLMYTQRTLSCVC